MHDPRYMRWFCRKCGCQSRAGDCRENKIALDAAEAKIAAVRRLMAEMRTTDEWRLRLAAIVSDRKETNP